MSLKSLGTMIVLLGVFCFLAPIAYGQCATESCVEYPVDGWAGWEAVSGGIVKPPTADTCTAWGVENQKCRECAEAYTDAGIYKGYQVCAFVMRSSACTCQRAGTPNCYTQGSCRYIA